MADATKFSYNLTHCYLEVARGGMTTIHHSSLSIDQVLEQHGPNPLANAILSAVSITVLYSFLAVESFVNYKLFRVWEQRHDGSPQAIRFLEQLGDFQKFEQLKSIDKGRHRAEELSLEHQRQVQAQEQAVQQASENARLAKLTEDQRAYELLPKGQCPSCETLIPLSAQECPKCRALFGNGSAWQVSPIKHV